MCLNPLRRCDAQVFSPLVSGNPFLWLLCPADMIPVFLWSFFTLEFMREIRLTILLLQNYSAPAVFSASLFFCGS